MLPACPGLGKEHGDTTQPALGSEISTSPVVMLSQFQMVTTDLKPQHIQGLPVVISAHCGVMRRIRPLWPRFPQHLVREKKPSVTQG